MIKSFAATVMALTLGLSIPAWAGDAKPAMRADQTAQTQSEEKRLPAAKEGTSTAVQAEGSTSEKATEPDQASKGKSDQAQPKTHPPTAVMDKAVAPEKSTSEKEAPPKHPPAIVMERATPEQKTPQSDAQPAK